MSVSDKESLYKIKNMICVQDQKQKTSLKKLKTQNLTTYNQKKISKPKQKLTRRKEEEQDGNEGDEEKGDEMRFLMVARALCSTRGSLFVRTMSNRRLFSMVRDFTIRLSSSLRSNERFCFVSVILF